MFAILQFSLCRQIRAWVLPTFRPATSRGSRRVEDFSLFDSTTEVSFKESGMSFRDRSRSSQRRKTWDKNKIKHKFHTAKKLERQGRWMEASNIYTQILRNVPKDAHTHLAFARLEARRELKSKETIENPSHYTSIRSRAEEAFVNGTKSCPGSVHIWQAWAVYEQSRGNFERARELFEAALQLDSHNPYVCHAFGLMEKTIKNDSKAIQLFEKGLSRTTTAALVCSLGELFLERNDTKAARDLYTRSASRLTKEKDRVEVFLAHAWLEEHYFDDHQRAMELIHLALELDPASSLANVALARLEGRMQRNVDKVESPNDNAAAKRLADICNSIEKGTHRPSDPTDGRIFNALARIEAKARNFQSARNVLKRGMELYPQDHAVSL